MSSLLFVGIGIAACVFCSAFFSATEMAYSSCSELRLENQAEEGNRRAQIALFIIRHFDDALSTILIGNNLANIAGSSLGSVFLILLLGQEKGGNYAWVSTVVMTMLVIIFGETVPKITAKKNANMFALRYAWPVRILMIILFPVVKVVVGLIHLVTGRLKGTRTDDSPEEAVEELQNMIETAEDEDVLDEDQSELVRSAIDFSEISAYECMTARVDILAIDIEDDWNEILHTVENSPYSRLPVYEGSIDNIIGILYLNHFLKALTENDKPDIRSHLMPPVFVYKTAKLPGVLAKLRAARQHLAVVSDEYGGVLGVVSMEDVLEEIVGDIWDETDTVEPDVVKKSEDEFEVDGDLPISDFLELVNIREDDFEAESETVGGWTTEMLGDFAKPGDSFEYENLQIKVLSTDGRRVERILICRKQQ